MHEQPCKRCTSGELRVALVGRNEWAVLSTCPRCGWGRRETPAYDSEQGAHEARSALRAHALAQVRSCDNDTTNGG